MKINHLKQARNKKKVGENYLDSSNSFRGILMCPQYVYKVHAPQYPHFTLSRSNGLRYKRQRRGQVARAGKTMAY